MAFKFYDRYSNLPTKVVFTPDTETCFVSQSEVMTSGLTYQLKQYGFDSLATKMENLRNKFGYADCSHINDFTTIQNKYVQACDYFKALPSEIRRKYNDTPSEFYTDIQNNPHTAYQHGFISEDFYKSIVKTLDNKEVQDNKKSNTSNTDSQSNIDSEAESTS